MRWQNTTVVWLKGHHVTLHGVQCDLLLDEFIQEMDKESLEKIALRPCDRVRYKVN